MGFPTPNVASASLPLSCRQIRIPDHPDWTRIVNGALAILIEEEAYEVYGSVSPADVAAYFRNELFEFINSECVTMTIPVGTVTPFAGNAAPSQWLLCEGQVVSRTTYATLFAAIGTTYGAGDSTTTFNLPDMRSRAPVGADGTRPRGTAFGAATHVLADIEMPSHRHFNQFISAGFFAWTATPSSAGVGAQLYTSAPSTPNINSNQFTAFTGSTQPHNNLPPSLSLNFIIYTGVP